MNTKSQEKIDLVSKLNAIIETRKILEKDEKALKEKIRSLMGEESTLTAGDLVVIRSIRNRKDLDKDAIMHDLGNEFFTKYSKTSQYEVMEVKRTALSKEA